MMSSRNKLFLKAPLTFQYSEEEELPVGSSSLLTMSERVSWDPGPHKLVTICSGEGNDSLPVKIGLLALASLSCTLIQILNHMLYGWYCGNRV